MATLTFPVLVEPLPAEEGGGFLASAPDLPGCMSDADTPEAAIVAIADAIAEWIDEAKRLGRDVPPPKRRAA